MALMQVTPDYLGGADGIQDILNNYYEQQIASIGTVEEQLAARKLIEEGLIVDGARVSLAAAIVKNNFGIEDKLLEKLLHTRLIRVENTHLGRAYEVSHDTLVRPILKSYETRRLKEERLEQKRLLAYEQKKRRRFRLLAILGTVLCIAALVVLFIVWRQSKALQEQKQHLELSMGVAEASVFFSENNYIGAFGKAYQAYKKYQKLVATDKEELKLDILKDENLKHLKEKEPYIYRNIWSSFYASDKLYILEDKVYSMPMPLVLDKAWLSLETEGEPILAGITKDGNLELLNIERRETDSIPIYDPMEWLMDVAAKSAVLSDDASKILYMDTTNIPVLFDRSSKEMVTLNLNVKWDNIEEKVFTSLIQEDGKRVVMFDDLLGGIAIFNSKGELTHDFPHYKFLALDNDQLYYRKEGFDQLIVLDLNTEAQYFILLPRYTESLLVLDHYLAAQLEGGAIARIAKEQSENGTLAGFTFIDMLEGDVEALDVFEKNTLIVGTGAEKGQPKVFLWELESGDKQTLGESYTDLLRVDSLMVYLDRGSIKIYQPSGLNIELILPNEFEYTQMYLLKKRFLCLPNLYQDKTLVIDFKMSPVLVEGPWKDQVIYSTPSKDGKQLLVVTPKTIYIQSLKDKSILVQAAAKEGWTATNISKIDFETTNNKVLVQTNDYVWSWDYKTGQEAFFEGKCYFGNGFLCQELEKGHYKFIDLATNEEIWDFEDSNITGCWFSPNKEKEDGWAILSRWHPDEGRGDAVFMDFNTGQRNESDITLDMGGFGLASVDYSPDGGQAAVFDQNTQQLFLVNSHGNYHGKTDLEGNAKLKWLNEEDLLVVNQKDIKILSKRSKIRADVFDDIPKLNQKRKTKGKLRVLNEKSNKFMLDWDMITPQLYKDYLFVNRKYMPEGDAVSGAGFMYVPYHNREILRFPDFEDEYVYPSAFMLSDIAEKAWTVSSFYKKIGINLNGFKVLEEYEKGYLLEFDLNPHKLFDRLKVSKNAIEELLHGTVMTIN